MGEGKGMEGNDASLFPGPPHPTQFPAHRSRELALRAPHGLADVFLSMKSKNTKKSLVTRTPRNSTKPLSANATNSAERDETPRTENHEPLAARFSETPPPASSQGP